MILLSLVFSWQAAAYEIRAVEGWQLHVRKDLLAQSRTATEAAVELLERQLEEVVARVPIEAVTLLREVPLFFSPAYKGTTPRAEYHPGVDWLRRNGRDPKMAKGVEFTNIAIFEAESRRMPNFALHELAHAYHDRVLEGGFANEPIRLAFENAKKSGKYERVKRRDAEGKETISSAYALSSPAEFFAEISESFFSRNDFQPFDRIELGIWDREATEVVRKAWGVGDIERPPSGLHLSNFYAKYFDASGYPVVSSSAVSDYALREAGYLIDVLLTHRHDVRKAMVAGGSRMVVIGYNEFTTDIPEYKHFQPKDFWDARARGLGGSETDPLCSCAEENVLGYPGDPYSTESIVIHEFAHSIHLRGLRSVDPTFQKRLDDAYKSAMKAGLWKGKYAATNSAEYFAEGVQSWFDNNRENDHDHNHVNTRSELVAYDPALAALCREVFGETELKYTKPATRLVGHMTGYNPANAPKFVWPERLRKAREEIRQAAQKRGGG